jgi:hypothetical protein
VKRYILTDPPNCFAVPKSMDRAATFALDGYVMYGVQLAACHVHHRPRKNAL